MVYGPPTPAAPGLKLPEGETPEPDQLPPAKSAVSISGLDETQTWFGAVITGVTGATTVMGVLSLAGHWPPAVHVIKTTPGPAILGLNTPEGLTPGPLQTAFPVAQARENGGLVKQTAPTSVMATVGV